MASSPLLSFITPSFNRADLVAETLDSLLAQTDPRWECVIVDDGSTDDSETIIRNYAERDPRIRFFHRDREPKGACPCRNIAVDLSRGKYLTFLDTDDLAAPHAVATRVRVMEENPENDFAILPSLLFRHKPDDLDLWWNIDKPGIDELTRQFHQDAIAQGTAPVFTREAFDRVGRWDETLALWQDIDLFFRLYIQGYRYTKHFDLEPDIHIRRLETSLSRAGFFAGSKQESRVRVVKTAVRLLRENDLGGRLSEARFMVAEIITGTARARQFDLAADTLAWACAESVLTSGQSRTLKRYIMAHKLRLTTLPGVSSPLQKSVAQFATSVSTLGKLCHSTTPAILTES